MVNFSTSVIYQEKQVFRLLIVLAVIFLFFPVFPYLVMSDKEIVFSYAVFSPLMVLLPFVINFWNLTIEITEQELKFGFGLIRKKFLRKDILSCEPFNIRFGDYFGYGIRYGRNNTVAWNVRGGKGVRLKIKNQKRDYVLSTDHVEEFCSFLNQTHKIVKQQELNEKV